MVLDTTITSTKFGFCLHRFLSLLVRLHHRYPFLSLAKGTELLWLSLSNKKQIDGLNALKNRLYDLC